MTNGDIHNKDRTLERTKTKIEKSPEISDRDKNLLIKGTEKVPSLLTYMQNQQMSAARMERYLSTWFRLSEYTDWNIEDVDSVKLSNFIGDLHHDNFEKVNGGSYADATKREIKKGIRKMYVDYIENFCSNLNVDDDFRGDEVIDFTLAIDRTYTDPERLPTPYTIKKLIEQASRPRDKAYIATLWSTGGRHGEVLGLKWRDVSFSSSVGTVTFRDTKTGGDHTVPMGEAMPYMKKHREADSKGGEFDEFVFRSTQSGNQLSGAGAANIIKRLREETDIPPQIKTNPHAFRKARTSYWARQGENEAWICGHMNWKEGNDVVAHYCRISTRDIEKGVARHLGLEEDMEVERKDESKILTPTECHECGNINNFEEDICSECGTALQTGELYEKAQIEEKTTMFMEEVISSETRFEPEELDKKAREFVKKELDI